MVGYLADLRYFSKMRLKLVNIFNVGSEITTIFFANRRNPDGIAISHKALCRSIIDCTSEPTISELDGGIVSSKERCGIFYM